MSNQNHNGLIHGGEDHNRTDIDRALVEAYDEDTKKHNQIAARHRAIARRALTAVATDPQNLHDVEVLRGSKDSPHHLSYQEAVHEQATVRADILKIKYPEMTTKARNQFLLSEQEAMLKQGSEADAEQLVAVGLKNKDAADSHKTTANENGEYAWNQHVQNEEYANLAKDVLKEL